MIEEYARHNGHADLLRQRIDGAIGFLHTRQVTLLIGRNGRGVPG